MRANPTESIDVLARNVEAVIDRRERQQNHVQLPPLQSIVDRQESAGDTTKQ